MEELSLNEQKLISLNVLTEIDDICQKNNFTYSLSYGTLLGAVRHGGFIPWDDDIDIMMPRSDYLKFVEYCTVNETRFKLASVENDPSYGYIFAKACDDNSVVINDIMKWQKYGVQVDIFPIDNLGNDLKTAKRNFSKFRFKRELLVAWNWKNFKFNKKQTLKRNVIKFIFYILSRFTSNTVLVKSIKNYYESIKSENSEYVSIICGAYRDREIMHKSIYEKYIDITFEDRTFKAIEKYDEYLTTIYGDYMKLPPEDKRVTHHCFKAYKK